MEKLAEMFLNTFHREHILLKLKIKKLLRKIKSKNLTAGVFFFFFFSLDPLKNQKAAKPAFSCPLGSWVSLWNFKTARGSLMKPK